MKLRRLTEGEAALARSVFGETLDPGRPWVVMGAPTGRWAMVVFGLMLFPAGIADFSTEPVHVQAWFVHELTHVRQFQRRPMWTVGSWAKTALSGGYLTGAAYLYPLPLRRPSLEQEAKAIEHAFMLSRGMMPADLPLCVRLADYEALLPSREGEGKS